MAAEIIWLEQARYDLVEIIDYIAAQNPTAAQDYRDGLVIACQRLRDFPLSGKHHDGEFRTIRYRNHLVFHSVDLDEAIVTIVMVVDARRDLSTLVQRPST